MKNFKLLSYFLIAALVWNCAPKAAKKAAGTGQYDEDLSSYRSKYELPQKASSATTNTNNSTATPADFGKDSDNAQVEEKMAAIREKNKSIKYTQGYRIQVYSGNSQEAAEKAKETVYRLDPNLEPEVIYFTPNFKVKVGNYYDRVEAYESLVKVRQAFPQALLLPERVSIK
jgi:hypothetical protein